MIKLSVNAFQLFLHKLRYIFQIVQCVCLLIASGIFSVFYKKRTIWLFRERGNDARDNAYWMFRYVKEHHPEVEAYYAITKDSPDRKRLEPWKDSIIEQNSFRHYVYMWRATHMLSTHICGGYPNMVRGSRLLYYILTMLSPKKTIWLQHGVILNDVGLRACRYNNLDMIVCSTQAEREYLCQQCGFPDKIVQLTGLARWDQLHDCVVKDNQILFMPTWRKWLNKENFAESEYFNVIASFLQMPQLHEFLEANGLTLVFYPHHEIQQHLHHFKALPLPDSITIAGRDHYDVQQLLAESPVLITDYSSLSMDFVYMQKALIYFLFDESRFREQHFGAIKFNYRDAFGPYATNGNDLLTLMKQVFLSGKKMSSIYKEKSKSLFPRPDSSYCEGIYQAIWKASI